MFSSLSSRAALLTGSVAAVAVLIAGIVAMPLIRGAAQAQAQVSLASQADLVHDIATHPNDFDNDASHMDPSNQAARALNGVVGYLRIQGVVVLPIIPGQTEPAQMTTSQIAVIANGGSVSARNCDKQRCVFVEARPVGQGTGVVLIQPMSAISSVTTGAVRRIAEALVIGFVIAVLLGLYFARRLARPLAKAAKAAHALALGEREVRLELEGPTEISEIAEALNVLAEELVISEGRQRDFLLSVSHELRTPLTAIRGYGEAMSDGMIGADEIAKVGNVVESESLRLDRLVSDLLDLARTGAVDFPLNMQRVNLVDVIAEASDVWTDRASREGVIFRSEFPTLAVFVMTDATRVRQIIDNLAENALRVTPAGEQIIFSLTERGVISIRDGGPGLSQDDIAVAFQPGELYERYRGVRRVGTGFGLALVGRLASRLGATAIAGRSPEGGAAFAIDFSGMLTT